MNSVSFRGSGTYILASQTDQINGFSYTLTRMYHSEVLAHTFYHHELIRLTDSVQGNVFSSILLHMCFKIFAQILVKTGPWPKQLWRKFRMLNVWVPTNPPIWIQPIQCVLKCSWKWWEKIQLSPRSKILIATIPYFCTSSG